MLVELVIDEYRAFVGQEDRYVPGVYVLWTADDVEVVVDPCNGEVRLRTLLSGRSLKNSQTGARQKSAKNPAWGSHLHGLVV